MAKAGQHHNDGVDAGKPRGHEKSRGRNHADRSQAITTQSYTSPAKKRSIVGIAVSSASGRIARWHVPRGLAAALVVFGFVGLLYGIGAWIAPTLATQGALLRTRVPEAVDRLEQYCE